MWKYSSFYFGESLNVTNEITTLTLEKYEYLPRLWPRNTNRYVMTVTEATILYEIMLWK